MRWWLALCVAAPVVGTSAAHAQMKALVTGDAQPAHSRTVDFDITSHSQFSAGQPFANGMITERDFSSNAFVGMGLVRMHGRKKDGSDMRADVPPVITQNPAVTFVVKF